MSVFGQIYAGAYDALYSEKDYADECDMVEALIGEFGTNKPVRRILDLGCGTGNHAVPLALRGYSVTGVDRSADMLARARAKAAAARVSGTTDFHQGDLRHLRLTGAPFDAAIMMFAVLDYQTTDDDVKSVLASVRAHLAVGAALVFDVWHGPGVIADKPGARERIVKTQEGQIRRRTTVTLDEAHHLCSVHFSLQNWRREALVESTQEDHVIRFFFPDEIERFAAATGFQCVALRCFPDWKRGASERDWTVVGVLRAV
jgi:SAM-dependent methyltransferase